MLAFIFRVHSSCLFVFFPVLHQFFFAKISSHFHTRGCMRDEKREFAIKWTNIDFPPNNSKLFFTSIANITFHRVVISVDQYVQQYIQREIYMMNNEIQCWKKIKNVIFQIEMSIISKLQLVTLSYAK